MTIGLLVTVQRNVRQRGLWGPQAPAKPLFGPFWRQNRQNGPNKNLLERHCSSKPTHLNGYGLLHLGYNECCCDYEDTPGTQMLFSLCTRHANAAAEQRQSGRDDHFVTVQVGWSGGALPLLESLRFCGGRRPPRPRRRRYHLNGYITSVSTQSPVYRLVSSHTTRLPCQEAD